MPSPIGQSHVAWHPCVHIFPGWVQITDLFERIAAPQDRAQLHTLESMTDPQQREEDGQISLVPPEERIGGPGTNAVMAAFTHLNPEGSHFSDGSYGVYYAAADLKTAVAEAAFHLTAFLRATSQQRIEIDMLVYLADLEADMHDLRGQATTETEGAALAKALHDEGADGIVFDSQQQPGGQCAAIFRPRLLSACRQAQHLIFVWDHARITEIYEKRPLEL